MKAAPLSALTGGPLVLCARVTMAGQESACVHPIPQLVSVQHTNYQTCATRVAPEKTAFRPVLSRGRSAGVSPEKRMAKQTYYDLLRHPNWQRKRLEILERADFTCEQCGDTEKTLNVHHKRYRKGAKPWEYENHELSSLCEDCHQREHADREEIADALSIVDPGRLDEILGFIVGLYVVDQCFAEPAPPDATHLPVKNAEFAIGLGRALGLGSMLSSMLFAKGDLTYGEFFQVQRKVFRGEPITIDELN